MKGIKMSDCRFYVDEELRTVVCVIPNTSEMVIDYIYEHFEFSDFDFSFCMDRRLRAKLEMPNSFRGRAFCAEEDEWDEETGKLIAFARAKEKCYTSFFKRANLFIQALDRRLGDMIDSFNEFGKQIDKKASTLNRQISELVEEEEDEDDEEYAEEDEDEDTEE